MKVLLPGVSPAPDWRICTGHPPPRDPSMAGQFSGAGGRLPIRHGLGGLASKSIHPFDFEWSLSLAAVLLLRLRCCPIHHPPQPLPLAACMAACVGVVAWNYSAKKRLFCALVSWSGIRNCPRGTRPLLCSVGPSSLFSGSASVTPPGGAAAEGCLGLGIRRHAPSRDRGSAAPRRSQQSEASSHLRLVLEHG